MAESSGFFTFVGSASGTKTATDGTLIGNIDASELFDKTEFDDSGDPFFMHSVQHVTPTRPYNAGAANALETTKLHSFMGTSVGTCFEVFLNNVNGDLVEPNLAAPATNNAGHNFAPSIIEVTNDGRMVVQDLAFGLD